MSAPANAATEADKEIPYWPWALSDAGEAEAGFGKFLFLASRDGEGWRGKLTVKNRKRPVSEAWGKSLRSAFRKAVAALPSRYVEDSIDLFLELDYPEWLEATGGGFR